MNDYEYSTIDELEEEFNYLNENDLNQDDYVEIDLDRDFPQYAG